MIDKKYCRAGRIRCQHHHHNITAEADRYEAVDLCEATNSTFIDSMEVCPVPSKAVRLDRKDKPVEQK